MDITLSLSPAKATRLFDALVHLRGPLPDGADKAEWGVEVIKDMLKQQVECAERDMATEAISIPTTDGLFD